MPRVICEVSESISTRVAELDLAALRAVFADLFDRANHGVQAARLDADDVILERYVRVQGPGGLEFTAAVEWLSDRERLIAALQTAASTNGTPCAGAGSAIRTPTGRERPVLRAPIRSVGPVFNTPNGGAKAESTSSVPTGPSLPLRVLIDDLVLVTAKVRAVVEDSP